MAGRFVSAKFDRLSILELEDVELVPVLFPGRLTARVLGIQRSRENKIVNSVHAEGDRVFRRFIKLAA